MKLIEALFLGYRAHEKQFPENAPRVASASMISFIGRGCDRNVLDSSYA